MHVKKGNIILIFLCFSNNHTDLRSDLFNLNMFHLMTYFATVMLIQGTFYMCETSFSPISPLPVNLVTTFHQYSHDNTEIKCQNMQRQLHHHRQFVFSLLYGHAHPPCPLTSIKCFSSSLFVPTASHINSNYIDKCLYQQNTQIPVA